MPGKTNGDKAVDNRVNGTKDVEMKDESTQQPTKGKAAQQKKLKDGDEEMTVVVPPSKASKLGGAPNKDEDGDVQMDRDAVNGVESVEEKVDPVAKAVAGML